MAAIGDVIAWARFLTNNEACCGASIAMRATLAVAFSLFISYLFFKPFPGSVFEFRRRSFPAPKKDPLNGSKGSRKASLSPPGGVCGMFEFPAPILRLYRRCPFCQHRKTELFRFMISHLMQFDFRVQWFIIK